jgi:hypothetical protein
MRARAFAECWQVRDFGNSDCAGPRHTICGVATSAEAPISERYCLACGYILAGSPSARCPECGRTFDPADPATFRATPPTRAATWRRWLGRSLLVIALATLAYGALVGWLWRDWRREQAAVAVLDRVGAQHRTSDAAAPWARRLLPARWQFLRNRVISFNMLSIGDVREDLSPLRRLRHVIHIHVQGAALGDSFVSCLAEMDDIATLQLESADITDDGLANLPDLPRLQALFLGGNRAVTDHGLERVLRLHRLEWLGLNDTSISSAGAARLGKLKRLRSLTLGPNRSINDEVLPVVARLPALEKLDLISTAVTDAGIAQLRRATRLEELSLAGTRVTDRGMASLNRSASLRVLDLGQTAVGESGLAWIDGYAVLEKLHLFHDPTVGNGAVSHLLCLTRLKTLYLYGTTIDDAGRRQLQVGLPGCSLP